MAKRDEIEPRLEALEERLAALEAQRGADEEQEREPGPSVTCEKYCEGCYRARAWDGEKVLCITARSSRIEALQALVGELTRTHEEKRLAAEEALFRDDLDSFWAAVDEVDKYRKLKEQAQRLLDEEEAPKARVTCTQEGVAFLATACGHKVTRATRRKALESLLCLLEGAVIAQYVSASRRSELMSALGEVSWLLDEDEREARRQLAETPRAELMAEEASNVQQRQELEENLQRQSCTRDWRTCWNGGKKVCPWSDPKPDFCYFIRAACPW